MSEEFLTFSMDDGARSMDLAKQAGIDISILPNIYGIYAERNVYPNLFLFVTAQASAGKGRLTLCRKLVEPIHRALCEQSKAEQQEYQCQLTEY